MDDQHLDFILVVCNALKKLDNRKRKMFILHIVDCFDDGKLAAISSAVSKLIRHENPESIRVAGSILHRLESFKTQYPCAYRMGKSILETEFRK